MSSPPIPKPPAEIVGNYLNSQLIQNHATATDWFELYRGDGDKDRDKRKIRYAWARYRHSVKGPNGDAIEFDFSAPELTLICNHVALLSIRIKSMYDVRKGISTPRDVAIAEVRYCIPITYYDPSSRKDTKGDDHNMGNYVLLCDFNKATIFRPAEVAKGDLESQQRHDVEVYLISYLKLLQDGRHHALFSPLVGLSGHDTLYPDVHLPLSISDSKSLLNKIFGFTANTINKFLSILWFSCAFTVDPEKKHRWDKSSWLAGCSSDLFTTFKPKGWRHASMMFRKPTATLLCPYEAILRFNVMEVKLSGVSNDDDGAEGKPEVYHDVEISLIVDISISFTGIRIKPETARHVTFLGVGEKVKSVLELLKHFFVEHYFKRFVAKRLRFLVLGNRRDSEDDDPSPEPGPKLKIPRGNSEPLLDIKDTTMEGFDVVIAVSQISLNERILQMFKMFESKTRKVQGEDFDIKIKEVTVALLDFEEPQPADVQAGESFQDENATTENPTVVSRAIITINVTEATLQKPLMMVTDEFARKPIEGPHNPRDCQLTFEVNVNVDDCKCTDARLCSGPPTDGSSLKHIYLDLGDPLIAPQYSPQTVKDHDPVKLCESMTLSQYIKDHYFPQLLACGMNILASVPVYSNTGAAMTSFRRLTSMSCRVFATEATLTGVTKRSEQILFVLGMVGGETPPSVRSFKPSASWLARGRSSDGTLAISGRAFRTALLPHLAKVNALTSFIHLARNNSDGTSAAVDILQWARHPDYEKETCEWGALNPGTNPNKFAWNWSHKWCVQESRSPPPAKREYHIRCETHNTLELPETSTSSNGPLKIVMSGKIELEVSSQLSGSPDWVTHSSLDWKIVIIIKPSTRGGGVGVDIEELICTPGPYPGPTKESSKPHINKFPDIHAILNDQLLQTEDLDPVLEELRKLEGDCEYYYPPSSKATLSTPTSNSNGDFLFELRHSAVAPPASAV